MRRHGQGVEQDARTIFADFDDVRSDQTRAVARKWTCQRFLYMPSSTKAFGLTMPITTPS